MSWQTIKDGLYVDGELDVQELHRDLARKHRNVGSKVETIWRNFTPKQREKAMRESVGDGQVLKHSRDRSLGVLCDYIPEYNLRDMASNPDHFLSIWKFRAEKDLAIQLYEGPNTTPVAAVQWVQKLDDHNARHDDDRKRLGEAEMTALGDLVIIVSLMHMMATAIPMAPLSRKSGLLFTARSNDLERELEILKPKADFGDYVVPADNLLEDNMATHALAALDDFVSEGAGMRLGPLYEDIVQDSLQDLETMYTDAKARLEKADKTTYVPLPTGPKPSNDARLASRREKEKTRPTGSSVYTITAPPETPQIVITESKQEFKVRASTAAVFTALFDKSEARSSVAWTDFEAAMADLEFSVTPKGGSVYTFNPPTSLDTRPITLHRPHSSDIEGNKVLIFARRLYRAYGWDAKSFVVA